MTDLDAREAWNAGADAYMSEPRPDAAIVAAHPKLDDCFRMPFFLIF